MIFVLIILSITLLPKQNSVLSLFENYDDATYFFYTNNLGVYEEQELQSVAKLLKCGNGFVVSCGFQNAFETKNILGDVLGESVRIKNYTQKNFDDIFCKYQNKIVFEEMIDDMKILYCYDNNLERFVKLFDKKVNIQIAIKSTELNIGYPLILNGY